ncbi:MAG: hypothetical protein U0136_17075 [Bdellovibrionota bacterium]
MRKIFILCGLIVVGAIIWAAIAWRTEQHYGLPFSGAPKGDLTAVVNNPADFVGQKLQLDGVVKDQCRATGCYFFFSSGDKRLRVELGDVAPTLPRRTDCLATVEGQVVAMGTEYEFIGTGVEFKKPDHQ